MYKGRPPIFYPPHMATFHFSGPTLPEPPRKKRLYLAKLGENRTMQINNLVTMVPLRSIYSRLDFWASRKKLKGKKLKTQENNSKFRHFLGEFLA